MRYTIGYGLAGIWASMMLAWFVIACTPAAQQRVVVEGQLYCALATKAGPLVVAVATASGAPIVATGMAQAAVAGVCAAIDAIPVAPPPDPAAAPVVAAPVAAVSPAPASAWWPPQYLNLYRHHTGLERT